MKYYVGDKQLQLDPFVKNPQENYSMTDDQTQLNKYPVPAVRLQATLAEI